jgi:hypothetical protein
MSASMTVAVAYSALSGRWNGVPQMTRMILLRISLILAFITFSSPAFSQAMAESVLLGAGSSTGTVSAGSALNSSLNRSSKQLAGRVQQQVLRPQRTQPPRIRTQSGKTFLPKNQTPTTKTPSIPQAGALIVSVQGAESSSPRTIEPASAGRGKTTLQQPATNSMADKTSTEVGSQQYKPVVTVEFPK